MTDERAAERAQGLDAVARADELYLRAQKVAEKLGDAQALSRVSERLGALRTQSGERLRQVDGTEAVGGSEPLA